MHRSVFSLAEQILKLPDAVLQIQHIQKTLAEEKQRRQEFYEWVNEDVKAEFINGEIVIQSPVKRRHWNASTLLSRLLSLFASLHKSGQVGVEKVMVSLTRNDYEPDVVFFPPIRHRLSRTIRFCFLHRTSWARSFPKKRLPLTGA